jgi:hypothetical protein
MPLDEVSSLPYAFGYFHGYCKGVSKTQELLHRYPISLQLRYKATSEHRMLYGFGETRMMSSKDIVFAPGDGLAPGMEAEIAVAWPFLLEGRVALQLVLDATMSAVENGVACAYRGVSLPYPPAG